jgi:hypothetical protein
MHRRRAGRRHVDRGGVVNRITNRRFGSQFERRAPSPSPRRCGERVASVHKRVHARLRRAMGASRVRGCVSRHANLPSPAGLTTQVGFIRLAHLERPKSGKPDFGWSILFVRTFLRTGWIAGSSPAMTTAIAARVSPSPGPRYTRAALSPTEVGFTRLRSVLMPNSGRPEFGCGARADRVCGVIMHSVQTRML